MEDQPRLLTWAAVTRKLREPFSTRGPLTALVLRVVMLILLGSVLLLLAGLTLAGTLIGLAVMAPLFVLFSPVLVPATLTIALVVIGFLMSVAMVLAALFFFARVNFLRKRTTEGQTFSGGEHEDAGASNSMNSPERSDSGPSASVDNGKGNSDMVVNQQQQNNGKSTLRKADDFNSSITLAPSLESNKYQVFLSFRGPDTRKNFVDHLYQSLNNAGIYAFRDNNELLEGEDFAPNICHAIKNSKISIPVFSQNYASSKWCLQELTLMVECMKSGEHIILPIFYDVRPADVRYQIESFGQIFSDFSRKYEKEAVDKWREALQEAATLQGWDSKTDANGHEGELVKLVVARVLGELKKAFELVVTEPVGIDNAVEEVLRLLDNPNATKIVGIHGMGGIGKTTLAKVIYNNLLDQFQHHSYIADIRNSKILSLQNKLIHDILKTKERVSNTDEGIKIMESRCIGKKVLILLDDVDHKDQLKYLVGKHDWFEVGSRIIITTRIKSVLNDDGVNCIYEHKEIGMEQALILFSRHAFLKNSPPPDFAPLSNKIISTTGRLPLALEVIGSYLCGEGEAFWQEALKKLEEVPHNDVQETLRISYDALNPQDKEMFLDIACFFIGTDVRIASYMWNFPRLGIDTLKFMSLIKIGHKHELKMHDQLRDLGRQMASQGMFKKRSRLWVYDKALEELQEDKKNNRNIEALRLDKDGSSKFMEEEIFERLPNLQFLHLREADFAGDFNKSLSKLRWLKWERCPDSFKANNVHFKELLILDLPGSYISQNWEGWSLIKMDVLRVLNLSKCSELKSTPNLSGFKSLEMLILENCENLEEIHPSIEDVKRLISLNLRCCGSLEKLPEQLGKLEKLEELVVDETDIRELPPSIGSLEKLTTLSAEGCHLLTRVPSSIIRLVSLSNLNLNSCKKLQELPDSFEALGKLERLSLLHCYMLKRIPSSMGKLKKLEELDLSSARIKELPESIGELNKLKILRISHSEIERLPSSIGKLQSLRELDASGCHKLGGQILVDEGGLSSLRTLRLGRSKISCLPDKLRELSTLEHLDLLYCSELQSLPEPPSRLLSLQLTCRSPTIPSLSKLSYLKELTLHYCMSLQSIPELPSCIRKLRVWKCPKLERLSNLLGLKSLSELELLQCYGLKELDGLDALKSLKKLDISTSTELSNLKDFEDLESLRYLDLKNCDGEAGDLHEIQGLGQLESLEVLNISGRKHIQVLDLSKSEHLKQLIVKNCESLIEIRCHSKFLEYFDSAGCKSLTQLPDFLPNDRR